MISYFAHALVFLVDALFGGYILLLALRLLFQWVRVDFYQPFGQFLLRVTNPPLLPLRRWIPAWRKLDSALVVLIFILQYSKRFIEHLLLNTPTGPLGLLLMSLSDLLILAVYIFMFSIIIQAVLSWVQPSHGYYHHNPLLSILYRLNEPLLAPARRAVPPISGFDLSPLIVILFLQLTLILIAAPIADMGRWLAH